MYRFYRRSLLPAVTPPGGAGPAARRILPETYLASHALLLLRKDQGRWHGLRGIKVDKFPGLRPGGGQPAPHAVQPPCTARCWTRVAHAASPLEQSGILVMSMGSHGP